MDFPPVPRFRSYRGASPGIAGGGPSGPPTDPYVRLSLIRFLGAARFHTARWPDDSRSEERRVGEALRSVRPPQHLNDEDLRRLRLSGLNSHPSSFHHSPTPPILPLA